MDDRLARQAEGRAQHQVQEPVQRGVVGFVQRFGAARAGIVDQEVDAAEPVERQLHDLRRRIILSHVDGQSGDPRRIADFALQRRQLGRIATDTDDRHAGVMQHLRRAEPDAAARPGDDRYLHLSCPLLCPAPLLSASPGIGEPPWRCLAAPA